MHWLQISYFIYSVNSTYIKVSNVNMKPKMYRNDIGFFSFKVLESKMPFYDMTDRSLKGNFDNNCSNCAELTMFQFLF